MFRCNRCHRPMRGSTPADGSCGCGGLIEAGKYTQENIMGAETFSNVAKGKSADEAFRAACEAAAYDYGHAGYTGTIAEKSEFVVIPLPEGRRAQEYAQQLIDEADPRIDDKWGPAGCIQIDPETYYFFGWASS